MVSYLGLQKIRPETRFDVKWVRQEVWMAGGNRSCLFREGGTGHGNRNPMMFLNDVIQGCDTHNDR
jgi:hypothetical protein